MSRTSHARVAARHGRTSPRDGLFLKCQSKVARVTFFGARWRPPRAPKKVSPLWQRNEALCLLFMMAPIKNDKGAGASVCINSVFTVRRFHSVAVRNFRGGGGGWSKLCFVWTKKLRRGTATRHESESAKQKVHLRRRSDQCRANWPTGFNKTRGKCHNCP